MRRARDPRTLAQPNEWKRHALNEMGYEGFWRCGKVAGSLMVPDVEVINERAVKRGVGLNEWG